MEYILGRQMQNNLLNNDLEKNYREALLDIGYDLVITPCSNDRPSYMKRSWILT